MTAWKGTKLGAPIVGGDDSSVMPTHYSVWGAGGYTEMPTIALRNTIPVATFLHDDGNGSGRRRNMMMVAVADSDGSGTPATYQLIITGFSGLTSNQKLTALADNANWSMINIGDLSDYVTLEGVQTLTNKTIVNPIINCAVGSDETDQIGDVYYRDAAGEFTRLGIGTNGQVLTSNGTLPVWSAPAATYTGQNGIGISGTTIRWGTAPLNQTTQLNLAGNTLQFLSSSEILVDFLDRKLYNSQDNYSYNWETGIICNPTTQEDFINSESGDLWGINGASDSSVDVYGRVLSDSGGGASISWNDQRLVYGVTKVNWQNSNLFDASGDQSMDWNTRTLISNSAQVIVDWENGYYNSASSNPMFRNYGAYASTGEFTADFENAILNDYAGDPSVAWADTKQLRKNGVVILNWDSQVAYDSSGDSSINWNSRQLQSDGGSTTVNYQLGIISDSSGNQIFDADSEAIKDADGFNVVTFTGTGRYFWNGSGVPVIDMNIGLLDLSGNLSVDWFARSLIDSTALDVLNWEYAPISGTYILAKRSIAIMGSTNGIILQSPNSHYWLFQVDNSGVMSPIGDDLGTTLP